MKIFNSFISKTLVLSLSIILIVTASCNKEDVKTLSDKSGKPGVDPVLNYLLKRGVKKERIQEFKDFYLVDEDIMFRKVLSSSNARPSQYFQGAEPLINYNNVGLITVGVDNSFGSTSTWRQNISTAAQQAINTWNAVPGVKLKFQYTHKFRC
jgi:hypothetical protein